MNEALELHDSNASRFLRESGTLRISLEPAYVHRSPGRPGVDAGEGYAQAAELIFSEARVEIEGACEGYLSEGSVSCDGSVLENLLPLPLNYIGAVVGTLVFVSGGVLRVSASGVSCMGKGAARFLEKYEG